MYVDKMRPKALSRGELSVYYYADFGENATIEDKDGEATTSDTQRVQIKCDSDS